MERPIWNALCATIESCVSPIIARSVMTSVLRRTGRRMEDLSSAAVRLALVPEIKRSLRLYGVAGHEIDRCVGLIRGLEKPASLTPTPVTSRTIAIGCESDVAKARSAARDLSQAQGFSSVDQVKIATVVSELAHNILQHAGTGTVLLCPFSLPLPGIELVASDTGSGIQRLDGVLSGSYLSRSGTGLGLEGCQRIMDEFSIRTGPGGTTVTAKKILRA